MRQGWVAGRTLPCQLDRNLHIVIIVLVNDFVTEYVGNTCLGNGGLAGCSSNVLIAKKLIYLIAACNFSLCVILGPVPAECQWRRCTYFSGPLDVNNNDACSSRDI